MSIDQESLQTIKQRAFVLVMTALLMSLAYGLMVSSAVRKSSTVDEQTHLFRGTAYLLEQATQFRDVHPPTGFALQSILLLTEPNLHLPTDTQAWANGQWELAADSFLWQLNDNPQRLIFLARLVSMWMTLLLGAVVFRWAKEIGGWQPALAAMVLLLFDPNILAHGRLMTNDISVTLFMTVAVFSYWRWATTGKWTAVLWFGLSLGLAGATKYSAITLIPALGIIAIWLSWRRRSWRPIVVLFVGGLISVLVIWGLYGFVLRPVPLAPLWDDLAWTLDYFGRPSGAYLLGETSAGGWWYYFPVAYLVKTPLAILGMAVWAIVVTLWSVWQRHQPSGMTWKTFLFLTLPPAVYLIVSLVGPLNIGYRHLLPILPYVALFTAVALLGETAHIGRWSRTIATAFVGSVMLLALLVWPDYIPYFNRLAGGPDRSWRVLSDSNIDWGQDLPALAAWNTARADSLPLYLSYFGTAHPRAYGVDYVPLPTWAPGPEQPPPDRQVFDPADPAPGWYALSVTNLHGQVLKDPDLYATFRDQVPSALIGDSIRIYEVPAHGPAFNLALAGIIPSELDTVLRDTLPGNDRHIRWLTDANSLIWSPGGIWMATDTAVAAELRPYLPETPEAVAADQELYHLEQPPDPVWATESVTFGDTLTLLGSQVVALPDGNDMGVLTYWEVAEATDQPIKLFVHALDGDGNLVSQWDGMGAEPGSLQTGDRFLQFHRLPAPVSAPERLVVGVYDGETLERLTTPDGRDAITIGE